MNITTIIVTFNRRSLLERCLISVQNQSRASDRILVVDNASTDGTREWLNDWLPENMPAARLLGLDDNIGGAGGFAAGMQIAIDDGCDWVWMMDDDAEPHPDALERLFDVSLDPSNVYSSVAVSGNQLAWPIVTLTQRAQQPFLFINQLSSLQEVASVPFLGILISASMIREVGLPDAGYFFQFDDVEYCHRCRKMGAKILLAGNSHIKHPLADRYPLRVLGRTLHVFRMPPWKRYYHVRNRIFLAKSHYGWSAYYSTIPASFLRLFASLQNEPRRFGQIWATFAGVVDGILNRRGQRHEHWGLRP